MKVGVQAHVKERQIFSSNELLKQWTQY